MKQKKLEFADQLQEKRQIGCADRAVERTDNNKISQAETNPETSGMYLLLLVMVVVTFRLRFTFQVGGYVPASWRLLMLWTLSETILYGDSTDQFVGWLTSSQTISTSSPRAPSLTASKFDIPSDEIAKMLYSYII